MFKQSITNINLSWNRETFKLLLIIFIIWSLTNYLYFYKNNNVNNINITNSTTQPDIGEPISIIQSQSPSQLSSQSQSKDAIMTLSPSTSTTNTSSTSTTNTSSTSTTNTSSTPTTNTSSTTSSTPATNTSSTFHVDFVINQKYCQSNTCRFLFAYYPPEQETQANQHFLSFVQLAEKLNRIMVLTNVGNSHIFACQPFPFDFYYNVDKLQKRFPNVKFITQKEFRLWTKERKEKPDTFHGFITINKNHSSIVNYVQPYVEKLNLSNCLRLFNLKLNDSTIFKDIYLSKGKNLESFEKLILKELDTNAEVLLIKHEIRYPLFKRLESLDYAQHIIDAANSISKKLRPYIASHWRMELGKPKMMPNCAKNLVKWVKDKESSTGIKNLYLATDYPLLGDKKAQSSTFHVITEYHINAIQILNSSVSLNTWVSLHPFDYLPKDKRIKKELMGAGIQGILDKLVLIQADYFVSCPEVCGRFGSKFTKKIREERTKNVGKKSYLKNVWEMWYEN